MQYPYPTYSSIHQVQPPDDLVHRAVQYFHDTHARVDDSDSGTHDETSTVSTDETGILTSTTTEAGDSEAEARN